MSFSIHQRVSRIEKAARTEYDIAVIGGGITGAGILLDAVSRGLKAVLIEKEDFAFGTSSRSTKLIHGGLRYLKNLELGLVRETGLERAIIYNNAAHIVRPENMLLPIYKEGSLSKMATSIALMVYDNLAKVEQQEKRKMMNAADVLELEPLLNSNDLESGGLYKEYRTDDARLVIEVIKKAAKYGAEAFNYCNFDSFIYNEDKKISGFKAKDLIREKVFDIKAKVVVNATGPWIDDIISSEETEQGKSKPKKLKLSKGIHLVIANEKLPVRQSVYFDTPDGRMIFAIPRDQITYIGTTDTFYEGDINDLKVNKDDIQYLINAVNIVFPKISLSEKDVISSWVGVRPLIFEEGKKPSELSRKDEIFISESQLVSIAGGKLTGYRKMAERAVDKCVNMIKKNFPDQEVNECISKQIKLSGGNFADPKDIEMYCNEIEDQFKNLIVRDLIRDLVYKYGSNTYEIIKSVSDPVDELELLYKELEYGINEEAVCNISDFLIRRTSMLYFKPNKLKQYKNSLQQKIRNLIPEYEDFTEQYERFLDTEIQKLCNFNEIS